MQDKLLIDALRPGAIAVSSGVFGDDIESTVLKNVDCYGNESEIQNCLLYDYETYPDHNAAVVCQGAENFILRCAIISQCFIM